MLQFGKLCRLAEQCGFPRIQHGFQHYGAVFLRFYRSFAVHLLKTHPKRASIQRFQHDIQHFSRLKVLKIILLFSQKNDGFLTKTVSFSIDRKCSFSGNSSAVSGWLLRNRKKAYTKKNRTSAALFYYRYYPDIRW